MILETTMSKTAAIRLDVKPDLIHWARKRSRKSIEELTSKFPNYQEWEVQPTQLTYEQLNRFAKVTHTALSYLLLSEPPKKIFHFQIFVPSKINL